MFCTINKKASVNITRRDILKIGAGAMVTQMVGFHGLVYSNVRWIGIPTIVPT